jgi:beta-D-xylosidase 4
LQTTRWQVDLTQPHPNLEFIAGCRWCGYPGQSGGDSLADIIFGVINPSGKTTLTWYDESFTQAVRAEDMGMRPNVSTGNPGRTYR